MYGAGVNDPLRPVVRAMVAAREPIDDAEQRSIETVLARLDDLDDPFDLERDPTHVTGSAFVVGERGVVLLRHKRLGIWLQPGGHLDPGESPWDAARREAQEETGLGVDHPRLVDGIPPLAHVDVHAGGRGHTHLDLRFVLTGDDRDPAPPPDESQEIGWFDWDAAIARADTNLAAALTAVRASFGR